MNDIKEKILAVMAAVFEIEVIHIPDEAAPGLIDEWDSLKHMSLIVALEEEFSIRFTDDELTDLINLELIQQIVFSKIVDGGL